MGYFQVRYDSRVVNYERKLFIRLATGRGGTKSIKNVDASCSYANFDFQAPNYSAWSDSKSSSKVFPFFNKIPLARGKIFTALDQHACRPLLKNRYSVKSLLLFLNMSQTRPLLCSFSFFSSHIKWLNLFKQIVNRRLCVKRSKQIKHFLSIISHLRRQVRKSSQENYLCLSKIARIYDWSIGQCYITFLRE